VATILVPWPGVPVQSVETFVIELRAAPDQEQICPVQIGACLFDRAPGQTIDEAYFDLPTDGTRQIRPRSRRSAHHHDPANADLGAGIDEARALRSLADPAHRSQTAGALAARMTARGRAARVAASQR